MEDTPSQGVGERPLRVVMVIQRFRPYFSGQGVQLEALARSLARSGVDVSILTAVRGDEAPYEEAIDGYRIRRLRCDVVGAAQSRAWSPTFAVRAGAALWQRRRDIDLVHVHGVNDALYTAWAFGRFWRIPVLFELTLTGADDPDSVRRSKNRFSAIRYAIYRRMAGYVAISPQLADAARTAGIGDDRLWTIPQGVDLERFRPAPDRAAARRALGTAGDGPLAVFVGSLIERKGIDLLLAAWETVHRRMPQAALALVGKDQFGGDSDAERFLARSLGKLSPAAAGAVVRAGLRDDAERFLQAADVFVFPSRREGFGSAIVEAMACGLPCVVADLAGITDYIFPAPSEASGGVVVPQQDPEAVARAVTALLEDPDRASKLGDRARARAAACFGIDRVAQQYLSAYAAVVDADVANRPDSSR
jgi:glycosyltransferase involved in cell wall biosynthesis